MKKDWQDMSDREFDDFFRKQAEKPDIPFEPEDWQKMKKKMAALPENGNKPPWYRRFNRFFWAISLLFIAAILVIGFAELWIDDLPIQENEAPVEKVAATNAEVANEILQKMESAEDSIAASKEIRNLVSMNKAGNKLPHGGIDKAVQDGKERREDFMVSNGEKSEPMTLDPASSYPPPWPEERWAPIRTDLKPINKEVGKKAKAPSEKQRPQFRNGQRWGLSAVVSPDVSALKWQEIHGVGSSAGLSLTYLFHPNWSVSVGALYAFKTYRGEGEYSLNGGYSASPVDLKGECFIVDVPVNVRYYPINGELGRWYISTGLSSYLMMREKYALTYETNGGYPTTKELDIQGENKHPFSVVNVSLGYERTLSEHLSIEVEPYLKLPWRGVGDGKVNLKSTGVWIGLKYNW